MAVKTQKVIFLQEAWKKAWRDGGAVIEFEVPKHKQRVRMMLYNAVKLAKRGLDDDAELNRAAQGIEIVEGPRPECLYLRLVSESPAIKAVEKLLGFKMAETPDSDVSDSLRRLEQMGLGKAPAIPTAKPTVFPTAVTPIIPLSHTENPFYPKRG